MTTDHQVYLEWITASEINNKGFHIQRSRSKAIWDDIGYVAGNGTTNTENSYGYIDINPLEGINYYRLRQVDHDGQYDYSKIVDILYSGNHALRIVPNPTEDVIRIIGLQDQPLVVFDHLGQRVRSFYHDGGSVDVSDLPSGIYFLKIEGEINRQVLKLVKE